MGGSHVAHILVLDELSKILELNVQDIGNQKALKKRLSM